MEQRGAVRLGQSVPTPELGNRGRVPVVPGRHAQVGVVTKRAAVSQGGSCQSSRPATLPPLPQMQPHFCRVGQPWA